MRPGRLLLDSLDVETYVKAATAEEAKTALLAFLKSLGFERVDSVFVEHRGDGARVRARVTVHRPGDAYGWLGGCACGRA